MSIEDLFFLIKNHGVEKALSLIEIESIQDHTVKVICRTIAYSHEELNKVLVDRLFDQNKVKS